VTCDCPGQFFYGPQTQLTQSRFRNICMSAANRPGGVLLTSRLIGNLDTDMDVRAIASNSIYSTVQITAPPPIGRPAVASQPAARPNP
jgi:hypothetical protein